MFLFIIIISSLPSLFLLFLPPPCFNCFIVSVVSNVVFVGLVIVVLVVLVIVVLAVIFVSQLLVRSLAFVVLVTVVIVEWQEDMLDFNKINNNNNNNNNNNTRLIVVVLLMLSEMTCTEHGTYQQHIICSHLLGHGTLERSKEQNERESEEPARGEN